MGDPRQEVYIDYTNYRGERSWRRIQPMRIVFENNEWHPQTQWLVDAVDLDKREDRSFALASIHTWFSAEEISIAKELLREKVSTSFLQRRMQINYNRAGDILRFFEAKGLISEPSSDYGVRVLVDHT